MLASAQKSGKAQTNATELRETRLAITGNTEKKDVYLSPIHVNLFMGVKTNYLEVYSEVCSAEHVVSSSEFNHSYQDTRPCHTICSILRSHYTTIYEYIRKDGTM